MKGMKHIFAAVALLVLSSGTAMARERDWAVSTNIPTWALLGTINADIHYRTASHWSLEAGARYNPFTYMRGSERQTQLRQLTPYIGIRYWADTAFEGWYFASGLICSEYSVSYPPKEWFFDGDLAGIGFKLGYNRPVNGRLALSLGAGMAAAYHNTTYYCGPVCGRIYDKREGIALFPFEATLSIMLML